MSHLTPEQLTAHLDGVESAATRAETERHLAECATCRDALAELREMERSLGGALTHDPGEEYFATFADRVEQRLRASGLRGAQSRGEDERERRWMEWLRSPRRLAWIGAMAAVIGGAAIVLITSREDRLSAIDESRAARESRRASAPPAAGDGGLQKTESEQGAAPVTGVQPAAPAPSAAQSAEPRSSDLAGGAPAKRQAAKADLKTSSAADERQAAAPIRGGAAPRRMMEMKKDASGNWVPAQPAPAPAVARFAPPPAGVPPGPASGGVRVRKPGMATPLGAQKDMASGVTPQASAPTSAAGNERITDQLETGETALCGAVLDVSGRPVAGASVSVASTGHVTFSGADGHFCSGAPAGDQELIVHAVGFAERRTQVRVAGEQANVQITLDAVSVMGDGTKLAKGETPEGGLSAFAAKPPVTRSGAHADPFAGLPDSTRRAANEARHLSTTALGSRSAAAYELAAARWERVLENVPASSAAAVASRYRVAEARYGAWDVEPTADRARAAGQALDAFLATAPEGAERDLALRWKAALGH